MVCGTKSNQKPETCISPAYCVAKAADSNEEGPTGGTPEVEKLRAQAQQAENNVKERAPAGITKIPPILLVCTSLPAGNQ